MKGMNIFIENRALRTRVSTLLGHLVSVKSALRKELDYIDEKRNVEYTDWYVLLKKDGDTWKAACYCPYDDEDGNKIPIEDFDVILPIPKPETLKDWDGF